MKKNKKKIKKEEILEQAILLDEKGEKVDKYLNLSKNEAEEISEMLKIVKILKKSRFLKLPKKEILEEIVFCEKPKKNNIFFDFYRKFYNFFDFFAVFLKKRNVIFGVFCGIFVFLIFNVFHADFDKKLTFFGKNDAEEFLKKEDLAGGNKIEPSEKNEILAENSRVSLQGFSREEIMELEERKKELDYDLKSFSDDLIEIEKIIKDDSLDNLEDVLADFSG